MKSRWRNPLTIVESPFHSEDNNLRLRNLHYAKASLLDSLSRGESPIAFHLLYPLVLNEYNPDDRVRGLIISHQWISSADQVVFYLDYGMTSGMVRARKVALEHKVSITERRILHADEAILPSPLVSEL